MLPTSKSREFIHISSTCMAIRGLLEFCLPNSKNSWIFGNDDPWDESECEVRTGYGAAFWHGFIEHPSVDMDNFPQYRGPIIL